MGFIKAGRSTIHFEARGEKGTPVLFVHGSCGAAAQWRRLTARVSESFRTFAIDLPGCGQSEGWVTDERWSQQMDTHAITALLDHIGSGFHAVLHSAGGNLAFESLVSKRDRIKSLTLFEPTYFQHLHHSESPEFAQPDEMAQTFRRLMDQRGEEGAMRFFVDTWAKQRGTWAALPDSVKEQMGNGAQRLYYEWDHIYGDWPRLADLDALEVPMLLFKGSETIDSMHAVCDLILSEMPLTEFTEIPGAGHMCPFTHADVVAPRLMKFLERHSGCE